MRGSDRPDIGRGFLDYVERYPFTFGVLAANLVLFGFCASRGGQLGFSVSNAVLYQMGANVAPLLPSEPWRLLTAAFLHADLLHLLFNCYATFVLGRVLEVHYGSARAWVLYFLFAVGGSGASALHQVLRDEVSLSIGSSGAVYGLILMGYLYARSAPARLGSLEVQFRQWIVVGVVFSLFLSSQASIDHAAHLGGAAAGALAGRLVRPRPGQDEHPAWTPLAHGCALATLASFAMVVVRLRQYQLGLPLD